MYGAIRDPDSPATEAQRNALRKWQVHSHLIDDPALTKGQASTWLDEIISTAKGPHRGDLFSRPPTPAKTPTPQPAAPTPTPPRPTAPEPVPSPAPTTVAVPAAATPTPASPESNTAQYGITPEQYEVLRREIAPGASPTELALFLTTCQRLRLDPFTRQVHYVRQPGASGERGMILVGIDGFRAIAEMSGEYDGQDPPEYVYDEEGRIVSATVKVYRKGMGHPIAATAYWSEYARPTSSGRGAWDKLPHLMIAKCAEALALRKAFPRVLSGVYEPSEMDQARAAAHVAPVTPVPTPPPTETPPSARVVGEHHGLTPATDYTDLALQVKVALATDRAKERKDLVREWRLKWKVPDEAEDAELADAIDPAHPDALTALGELLEILTAGP